MADNIKTLDTRILADQQRAQSSTQRAQVEREKAARYIRDGNDTNAQVHTVEAQRLDQESTTIQNEIQALNEQKQQIETQIAGLEQQRMQLIQTHDQKLRELTNEIERLRGGSMTL